MFREVTGSLAGDIEMENTIEVESAVLEKERQSDDRRRRLLIRMDDLSAVTRFMHLVTVRHGASRAGQSISSLSSSGETSAGAETGG